MPSYDRLTAMDWKDRRLYVNLADIRDYDFFARRITFSGLGNAGPRFCRTGREYIQLLLLCLGHKWNSYWTASDPAGSPNPQAGTPRPNSLKVTRVTVPLTLSWYSSLLEH